MYFNRVFYLAIIELLDGEFECQVVARMTVFPLSQLYQCVFIGDLNMDVEGKEFSLICYLSGRQCG